VDDKRFLKLAFVNWMSIIIIVIFLGYTGFTTINPNYQDFYQAGGRQAVINELNKINNMNGGDGKLSGYLINTAIISGFLNKNTGTFSLNIDRHTKNGTIESLELKGILNKTNNQWIVSNIEIISGTVPDGGLF
jgi:hypothetical protein